MEDYVVLTIVPGKLYALFDAGSNRFELDRVSADEVAARLAQLAVPRLKRMVLGNVNRMGYDEARVRAGTIACCACNRPVSFGEYNSKLADTRQWCAKCKGAM